ncbi:MAG: hypothetical protein KatS3mg015_2898 [Fimbriimonadales bacterium]|nr:MAG: hypothetical protein KatS3mg015_2898 [Fimbriimonadales bacterium]
MRRTIIWTDEYDNGLAIVWYGGTMFHYVNSSSIHFDTCTGDIECEEYDVRSYMTAPPDLTRADEIAADMLAAAREEIE